MMKKLIFIIFSIIISTNLFGQDQICGKYINHCGQKFELKPDSTFLYKYRWGLSFDEVIGKWKFKDDTLYLNEVIIYDTIYYKDTTELVSGTTVYITKKKLIRSEDDKADVYHDRIDLLNRPYIPENASFDIKKLYLKRNKLFKINNEGEIINTKQRCITRKKRSSTYFFKQK